MSRPCGTWNLDGKSCPDATFGVERNHVWEAPMQMPRKITIPPQMRLPLPAGHKAGRESRPGSRALDALRLGGKPESARTAIAQLREMVNRIRTSEASEGPWTAAEGYCLDLSSKWCQRLSAAGVPAVLVVVEPEKGHRSVLEPSLPGKFHAYLTIPGPGDIPIHVNSTIRQFFLPPHEDIPEVFVGSEAELRALFRTHGIRLRSEIEGDDLAGSRDPGEFVSVSYGFGGHRDRRVELGSP